MMRRRVMALLLAVAVAGIPEALAVCRVLCAWSTSKHEAASSHAHEHANSASDRSSAPGAALSITDEAHPCGRHREHIAPLTAQPERATTVAIATPVALIVLPLPTVARHDAIDGGSRSPSVTRHTPLRI